MNAELYTPWVEGQGTHDRHMRRKDGSDLDDTARQNMSNNMIYSVVSSISPFSFGKVLGRQDFRAATLKAAVQARRATAALFRPHQECSERISDSPERLQ